MVDRKVTTVKPKVGQTAVMTLLILLAYLPLVAELSIEVTAYVGFLILLRLSALRWPRLEPGRWLLLPLTVAGGTIVYHAYHTLASQEGGTALLATMLALKLLETRSVRDIRVVNILFGFLLVSQFLFAQSPWLAAYLGGLLVVDFALMADLNARQPPSPFLSALRIAGSLTLQAIPLALVLFAFFPRLSAPLWSLGHVEEQARSGIKDWLEPGSVSDLVIDGGPAFRARFEGRIPAPELRYWRGPVLWTTDGRRWTPASAGELPGRPAPLTQAENLVTYTVTLEPADQKRLFALDLPVEPPTGFRITGDFQIVSDKDFDEGRGYRMVSALTHDTGELDLDHELAGLQLPENVTPRMRALADEWKTTSNGAADVVRAGLEFFNRQPFHYTLLPPELGENPTDEFLFETQRGFCEHYASSFTILMRLAGIPARVVLGFLGGEFNPMGNYLIVRRSDAHAWVEVWLDGEGWRRVDPTAAVSSARIERTEFLEGLASGTPVRFRSGDPGMLVQVAHTLALLADSLNEGWREWVLGLNEERQQRMLDLLGLGFLREYGLAVAMIVASSVILALLRTALVRSDRVKDPLDRIYVRFCRKLERVGFRREEREGPVAFSARVVEARPDLRDPVEGFLGRYLPLRYGRAKGALRVRELSRWVTRFHPSRTLPSNRKVP